MNSQLTVLFHREEESWQAFLRRVRETEGETLIVLSSADASVLLSDPQEKKAFFEGCKGIGRSVRLALRHGALGKEALDAGLRVCKTTGDLRRILRGHPLFGEAVGVFSPHLWRQHWRTRLQGMGLLSLPRLRIWILIVLSIGLFLFVSLRLLPSAEVRVWPRQDPVNQTANIILALSGAHVEEASRVRQLPLVPITVTVRRSITFDQISKEFTGTNARVTMTVVNRSQEVYGFKKGTRLVNQAGMVFRIQQSVTIPAGGVETVSAMAEHQDIYGQDIGERGNVPAGLRWDFLGLPEKERVFVYAENRIPAQGGKTSSRTVLQAKDIDGPRGARKHLEAELLATAKQLIDEELLARNEEQGLSLEFLVRDELVRKTFADMVLPTEFIGREVSSVPAEGSISYTMFAYDAHGILSLLRQQMSEHIVEGKQLLYDSLTTEHLKVYVIAYADDLSWIKLTADLTGTEQFILDPLTPSGARFARKLREQVAGLPKQDAIRIVKNMPEVEKVEIGLWPPWSRRVSGIPPHIALKPM